jgi:xylulose-5-phosphate/fructose-6-phosphate phosphoketolase
MEPKYTQTKISSEALEWYKKYHRMTNYIGAAQLYLKDNHTLEKPLEKSHIKERLLGHWGTVPGINFMYGAINWAIKKYDLDSIFIAGSGHGAPAVLANLFLEGSLGEFYPQYSQNIEGMERLIHDFSWPDKLPSHSGPNLPGIIHEGGELGYSLATAFGAVLDNPQLLAFVEVGDGEAETGPLAASWHLNKFLNPKTDGVVLPMVNINGYKISNPTLFATMSDNELNNYFEGLGWEPIIVDQYTSADFYEEMLQKLGYAIEKIREIQFDWRNKGEETKPIWPVLLIKNKKGWTGPVACEVNKLEDNCYSHGIPLSHPQNNDFEFKVLSEWLSSYNINELIQHGKFAEELFNYLPQQPLLTGMNPVTLGGINEKSLATPDLSTLEYSLANRGEEGNSMLLVADYLKELISENREFRVFSPDEAESNRIEKIYEATHKQFIWPTRDHDKFIAKEGQVLEILSEHVLQALFTGYTLTGRHGLLVSYEAFLSIIVSQIDQHIKFLKKSKEFPWRKSVPSLNLLSTSTAWIQEHNGFSHQNPALLSTLLCKQDDIVNIYFPADANISLVTIDRCISSQNKVNLITCSKRELPQWLTLDEAKHHVEKGVSIWKFASTDKGENPDVVLCAIGDTQTQEVMAAIKILNEVAPMLKVRMVNVNELTALGIGSGDDLVDTVEEFEGLFTNDKPVIINYHGYPQNIKTLLFETPIASRVSILGFIEQGTTTTTFDMQIKNKTSRYHVAIEAIKKSALINHEIAPLAEQLVDTLNMKIQEHRLYIAEHGDDSEEIKDWKW